VNESVYETYRKSLLPADEKLRSAILRAFIEDESVAPDNLDLLVAIEASVLNDRSSQCGLSVYTESLASESFKKGSKARNDSRGGLLSESSLGSLMQQKDRSSSC
jgi:hypothetical protein